MTVENANYIPELVPSNPGATDFVAEGEDHLTVIKQVLQNQFPSVPVGPVVNAGEDPDQPDETLTAPDNVMLWSPKAISDFIKKYWDGWALVSQAGTTFRATLTGPTRQIQPGETVQVEWAADWDTSNSWDVNNHAYVIPQAGVWLVRARMAINWSNNQVDYANQIMTIRINDAIERSGRWPKGGNQSYNEDHTIEINTLMNLALDDTVKIYWELDASNGETITRVNPELWTEFSLQRVGDAPA